MPVSDPWVTPAASADGLACGAAIAGSVSANKPAPAKYERMLIELSPSYRLGRLVLRSGIVPRAAEKMGGRFYAGRPHLVCKWVRITRSDERA
jgi:hypothetical protein